MSSLIKGSISGEQDIQSSPWSRKPRGLPDQATPDSLILGDPHIAALERTIADLRARVEAQTDDLAAAVEAARLEGRREAASAHVQKDERALEILRGSAADAGLKVQAHLNSLEALALALCETAMGKVFSDVSSYRDVVSHAIGRQLEQLKNETVLRLRVSSADFPDAGTVKDAVLAAIGYKADVQCDPKAPQGTCTIELRLGQVEISIPEYWGKLRDRLRALAEGALA